MIFGKRKRSSTGKAATMAATAPASPEPESPAEASSDPPFGEGGEPAPSTGPVLSDCPYTVEFRSKGGQRKRAKKGSAKKKVAEGGPPPKQELDKTPPEDNSTVYRVNPENRWQSLKKYRNFVVGTETFALNEYVFINHTNIPHGTDLANIDDTKFWVARVLEIKAEDEAHVYLRVYWMYWPEELPGGRQPYHGHKELVASNHMEVVDAMTVSGRANVKHWLELDEDEELPNLFWRQKFDFPTQALKEIRQHCRCHQYYNPDKLMVGCPSCDTWLHEDCIVADIKQKVLERGGGPPPAQQAAMAPAPTVTPEDESGRSAENTISVAPIAAKAPLKRKGGGKGKSLFQSAVDNFVTTPALETPTKTTPASQTPATNGKSTKKKTKAEIKSELDSIEVTYVEGSTKARVKDLRAIKQKANRTAGKKENVVKEEEPDEKMEEGGEQIREWDEDVCCLVCNAIIE